MQIGCIVKVVASLKEKDHPVLKRLCKRFYARFNVVLLSNIDCTQAMLSKFGNAGREILNQVQAGLNVNPNAEDICNALRQVLEGNLRYGLAMSGLERSNNKCAPASVPKQHMKIFEPALCN